MLILKNIVKDYVTGDTTVRALKGIDINFRESEFVSILGPSGCGKTTLLNIIGGLDRYTSGDLRINGKSTTAIGIHTVTIQSALYSRVITLFSIRAFFPMLNLRSLFRVFQKKNGEKERLTR